MARVLVQSIASLLLASAPALSLPVEQIVNGDFETGDLSGWTSTSVGLGNGFRINDGTFLPPPGVLSPAAPIGGSYDAVSSQTGPGLNALSQSFVVPHGIASATLRFDDRIENLAPVLQDPNQEFRVLLQDMLGTTVFEVFSTDPGDPPSQPGPNHREFDLTLVLQALEGQTIQLAFEQQDDLSFFNATIDDVSLLTEAIPEPGAAALFGLGTLVVARRTRRWQGAGRRFGRPSERRQGC